MLLLFDVLGGWVTEAEKKIKKRIGEILVERGVITVDQLKEALIIQNKSDKLIGDILVELGYAQEEDIITSLSTQYGIPFLPVESYDIDQRVMKIVPQELIKKYNFLPVDKIENLLTIAVSDVIDSETVEDIEKKLNCKIQFFLAVPTALKQAIKKYYG